MVSRGYLGGRQGCGRAIRGCNAPNAPPNAPAPVSSGRRAVRRGILGDFALGYYCYNPRIVESNIGCAQIWSTTRKLEQVGAIVEGGALLKLQRGAMVGELTVARRHRGYPFKPHSVSAEQISLRGGFRATPGLPCTGEKGQRRDSAWFRGVTWAGGWGTKG